MIYISTFRVAAKILVLIILPTKINSCFAKIFLKFREILKRAKLQFVRNFRNFAKHEIKISANFLPFC